MNTQPLDELYFQWLYSQVADPEVPDPSLTYWKLLKILFTKEAVWLVENDENRLEDGKALRFDFLSEKRSTGTNHEWVNVGCSVLELMVGLSRRLAFEAEGEPHYWFWRMTDNLGLLRYSDDLSFPVNRVEDILNRVIFRTYKRTGLGGFFPLKYTKKDQRKIEIWYQAAEYLREQNE